MFQKIVKNVVTYSANSAFERARLRVTYKRDKNQPSESQMKVMMTTLRGEDHETPAGLAFTTLMAKLEASDGRKKWNYLLKNLIIFDHCLEERCFIREIAELKIDSVEEFVEKKQKYKNMLSQEFLKSYYFYLKFKAAELEIKDSCFLLEHKNKLKNFLAMDFKILTDQLERLQSIFEKAVEVSKVSDKGILQFSLCQYVFKLILSTLVSIYSNQYQIIVALLEKVFKATLPEAQHLRQLISVCFTQTDFIISFIDSHQFIQGFQILTSEFVKFEQQAISSLDSYIKYQQNEIREQNFQIEKASMNTEIDKLNDLEGRSSIKKIVINFENIENVENELKLLSDDEEVSERSSPKENLSISPSQKNSEIDLQRSPLKLISSASKKESIREFKFQSDDHNFNHEIFDKFCNTYSHLHTNNIIEDEYSSSNFELQVRLSLDDKLLLRRQTLNNVVEDDTEFVVLQPFDERIFHAMENGYSKDFKINKHKKQSKDDYDMKQTPTSSKIKEYS